VNPLTPAAKGHHQAKPSRISPNDFFGNAPDGAAACVNVLSVSKFSRAMSQMALVDF
jgi:hypothetical protein